LNETLLNEKVSAEFSLHWLKDRNKAIVFDELIISLLASIHWETFESSELAKSSTLSGNF